MPQIAGTRRRGTASRRRATPSDAEKSSWKPLSEKEDTEKGGPEGLTSTGSKTESAQNLAPTSSEDSAEPSQNTNAHASPSILKSRSAPMQEDADDALSHSKKVQFDIPNGHVPRFRQKLKKKSKSPSFYAIKKKKDSEFLMEDSFRGMESRIAQMVQKSKEENKNGPLPRAVMPARPKPKTVVCDVESVPVGKIPDAADTFYDWMSQDEQDSAISMPIGIGATVTGPSTIDAGVLQSLLLQIPKLADAVAKLTSSESISKPKSDSDVELLPYPRRLDLSSPARTSKEQSAAAEDQSDLLLNDVQSQGGEMIEKQKSATKRLEDLCTRQEQALERMEKMAPGDNKEIDELKIKLSESESRVSALTAELASCKESSESKIAELEQSLAGKEKESGSFQAEVSKYKDALEDRKQQLDKAKKLDEKRRSKMRDIDQMLIKAEEEFKEKTEHAKSVIAQHQAKNTALEEEVRCLREQLRSLRPDEDVGNGLKRQHSETSDTGVISGSESSCKKRHISMASNPDNEQLTSLC